MPLHAQELTGHGETWRDGSREADELVVAFKQTFDLESGKPIPAAEPLPLAGMDLFEGETEESPVRYESDFVPFKPATDLLCAAHAWAPRGEPTSEVIVTFGVGRFEKKIRVIGDRIWKKKLLGLAHVPSSPQPFVSMPITFERAFGGRDGKYSFEANPLGRGYHRSVTGLAGKPLPNLEDPASLIEHWRHRPAPRSFGPVGRAWLPRRALLGTFGKKWTKERAPELPEDFDERFYDAAPMDQQLDGYLRGDETVRAVNLHPDHPELVFRLPGDRLRCIVADPERPVFQGEVPLRCDTLWLDMDALTLVLVWRGRAGVEKVGADPELWIVKERLDEARDPSSWEGELQQRRAEEAEPEQEVAAAEHELAGE